MIVYYIWNVLSLGLLYAMRVALRKSFIEANEELMAATVRTRAQAFEAKQSA